MADATSRKFVDRDENKSEKPRKIARVEVKSDQSEADCITSLKDFKFCKILYNDINSRTIYIQGLYSFPYRLYVIRVGKYACFCLRVVATKSSFSAATCEQSQFLADMRQNQRSC